MTGPERNNREKTGKEHLSFFRRLLRAWLAAAGFIGRINTLLLLGVLFFLVVTPIGLIMRPFRKGILLKGSDTWIRRQAGGSRERQF